MTTTINADNTLGGAIVSGDSSGILGLQAGGVTKVTISSSGVVLANALPIASGGTNSTATPTAGGIGYGTGTAYAYTAVGTSGQYLQSAGAGTPVWATIIGGAQGFVTQTIGAGAAPPGVNSFSIALI